MKNISSFLQDFINEKDLNKKRASSMMSLRQSKTLSSFTTCDDSICIEEIKDGIKKINLNNLMIENNNEINPQNKKTKEMIQKSQNLYQEYLNKNIEKKEDKKKFGKIPGLQRTMTIAGNLVKMFPKYKEIEKENENNNIEYKNNKITYISADLLLKKIIFDDFLNNNIFLIQQFCNICFCFLNVEIFFKKIFHCYEIYKHKEISLDKLKNLIEFINILIIELYQYYEKINYNEMHIPFIRKKYYEIISDLIINFKNDDNITEINKNINSEIKENNNIDLHKRFRFDSYDMGENKSSYDFTFDKKNLLNINLNYNIKNINIFILKENNEQINKALKETEVDINKKGIQKSNSLEMKKHDLYKILKTIKKTNNSFNIKKSKIPDNIKEEIKEENNEEDSNSSSDQENVNIENIDAISEKENEIDCDELLSDEENSDNPKIIDNLINKVFKNNYNLISTKEEIMPKMNNILSLLNLKDGIKISLQNINKAKSVIPFYKKIKIAKASIFTTLNLSIPSRQKKRSNTIHTTFKNKSLNPNSNPIIKPYFCVTDWNTEDIGDKLTQVSISLLNKIHPRELLRGVYLKKDKDITSPNVVNCINNFNKLTSFIIEDIISYDTPKLRARTYEKWVQICDYCRINHNYNDCFAIYSALNNYIITGLTLTSKEIKSKTNIIFAQISKFCSCDTNYKNARNDMKICEQNGESFIPYLGMLLRDLNFFEEKKNYINEKGFINIEKIEDVNNLLDKYFKYKNDTKKKIDKNFSFFLDFFNKLELIDEEYLENIANNIEPVFKYGKQEIKRLTNIDKNYFQRKMKKRGTICVSNMKMEFGNKKGSIFDL